MTRQTVHQITNALGIDEIAIALNVSKSSVRFARTNGAFSANWYGPLKILCDEAGIPCPLSAFRMRSITVKRGNAHEEAQAAEEAVGNQI